MSFVGNVEGWPGIRLIEGIILQDLGEKVECRVVDRHIRADKTPYIIKLPRKEIKIK